MGIICFTESGYKIKLLSERNAIKVVDTHRGRGRNCVQLLLKSINKWKGVCEYSLGLFTSVSFWVEIEAYKRDVKSSIIKITYLFSSQGQIFSKPILVKLFNLNAIIGFYISRVKSFPMFFVKRGM